MSVPEKIQQAIKDAGLSMSVTFVPWSQSRNAGEKEPSLNWKVTVLRTTAWLGREGDTPVAMDTKPILTTDYSAGCGHCPSYKPHLGKKPYGYDKVILWECENGRRGHFMESRDEVVPSTRKDHVIPEFADVLHSLLMDAEAIDHPTFEDWAENFGFNKDSRKAEAVYRACLETGLKLRAALGDEMLAKLRAAFQDY